MAGRRGWNWRACGWSVCPSATFDVLDVQGGSRTATGQRLGSGRSGLAGGFCNLRQPNFRQVARRSFSGTFASFSNPSNPPRRSHHHQAPKTPRQDFQPPPSQWVNTTTFSARRSPPNTLPWVFSAPSSAASTSLPAAAARPLLLPPSTLLALTRPTLSRSSSRPPRPPRSRLPLLPPPSTKVPENDSYDDRNGHEALRTGLVLCTYIATG